MANPTQVQVDKFTVNVDNFDIIVNGDENTTVNLDSGVVKTVSGILAELKTFNDTGAWGTSTVYAVKDLVLESSVYYTCLVGHTSGVFATDLAAGKWGIYQVDFNNFVSNGTIRNSLDGTAIDDNGAYTFGAGKDAAIYWDGTDVVLDIVTALTSTVQYSTIKHETTGTPANGIGIGHKYIVETSAANNEIGALVQVIAADVSAGVENFDYTISLMAGGAAAAELFRLTSAGLVGIGLVDPGNLLEVRGTSDDKIEVSSTAATSSTGFQISMAIAHANLQVWQLQTDNTAAGNLVLRDASAGTSIITVEAGAPDNSLYIATTTGNVGINTATPGSALDVKSTAFTTFRINSTRDSGAIGGLAFIGENSDSDEALYSIIQGDVSVNTAGAEDGLIRFYISEAGSVQENFQIQANGALVAPRLATSGSGNAVNITAGGEFFENTSSERFKENIKDLVLDTDWMSQISPVMFDYKDSKQSGFGYIAEWVEKEMPLNQKGFIINYEKDGTTPRGIDYSKFVVYLVQKTNELTGRLLELESKA